MREKKGKLMDFEAYIERIIYLLATGASVGNFKALERDFKRDQDIARYAEGITPEEC